MNEGFFTTNDIRGMGEPDGFIEVAWQVGKAFADWLPTTGEVVVLRGDEANEHVVGAIIEGLRLQGRDVIDGGIGDVQHLSEMIPTAGYSGGVFVEHDTMSSLTVIELFDENGRRIDTGVGLEAIAELVSAGNFVPARIKGELHNDLSTT